MLRPAALVCLFIASDVAITAQSTVTQLADTGWQAINKGDADKAASAFREALTRP